MQTLSYPHIGNVTLLGKRKVAFLASSHICVAHSRMGGTDGAQGRCGYSERFLFSYGGRGASCVAPWQVWHYPSAWSPTLQSAARSMAKAISRKSPPDNIHEQAGETE